MTQNKLNQIKIDVINILIKLRISLFLIIKTNSAMINYYFFYSSSKKNLKVWRKNETWKDTDRYIFVSVCKWPVENLEWNMTQVWNLYKY